MMNHGDSISSETVHEGHKFTKPEDPDASPEYSFGGWYTDSEFQNAWDFNTVPTQNMTLYAKWIKEYYTVHFNSKADIPSQNVKRNTKVTKPEDPVCEGYKFVGWFKDRNGTQPWDFDTDVVTKDYTYIYAKYTRTKVYGVCGGGQEVFLYNTVTGEGDLTITPTFKDYVFKGWYTLPIGGIKLDPTQKDNLKDVYYAQWEKKNGKPVITVPLYFIEIEEESEEMKSGVYSYVAVEAHEDEFMDYLDNKDLSKYGISYNANTKTFTLEDIYCDIYDYVGGILTGEELYLNVVGTNIINITARKPENDGVFGIEIEAEYGEIDGSGEIIIDVDGRATSTSDTDSEVYGVYAYAEELVNKVPITCHVYGTRGMAMGISAEAETISNYADIDVTIGAEEGISQAFEVGYGIAMMAEEEVYLGDGEITIEAVNFKSSDDVIALYTDESIIKYLSSADSTVENGKDSSGQTITALVNGGELGGIQHQDITQPVVISIQGNKSLKGVFSNGSDPVVLYDKKSGVSNLNYQPTYGDYIFDGWYTRPIGGEKITPTEDVLNVGENTLYAQWKNAEGVKVLERTLIVAITNADAVDSPYHDAPVIGYYDGDREWVYFNDLNALSGYGITYNDASGALVLDGVCADIQAIGDIPAWIYAVDEELKLELGGENEVRVAATEQQETYYGLYGIAAAQDVNISGDGALDLVVDGSGYPSDEAAACGIYSMGSTTCEANITLEVSGMKNLYGISAVSEIACAGELKITVGSDDFEALTGIGIETETITYNGGKISVDIINISGDNKAIEWTGKIFSNKTNKVTNAVDNSNKSITEIETFEETSSLSQKEAGSPLVIEEKSNPLPPPGPGPNPPTPGPSPDPSPAPEPEPEPKKPVEYEAPAKNAGEAPITAVIEEKKAVVDEISEKMLDQIVKDSKEKPAKDKTDDLVIDLSKAEEDVEAVVFSKESIENIADAVSDQKFSSVTIVLSDTEVKLDSTAVESISKQMTGDVIDLVVAKTQETTLSETQKESVRSLNVQLSFEAYFECNGKRIGQFGGGVIEVSMSYLKSPRQNSDFLHVYYIGDDGTRERYNTKYKNGRVIFSTKHFSDYVIVYDEDDPNENHVTEAAAPDVNPEFGELRPWSSIVNGKKFTISWEPVEGADGYEILASKCNSLGQKYKIRNIKTINGGDVTSYTMKSLKKGTFYKFKIRAFKKVNGKKVTIASSVLFHTVTNGGKFDVADYVEVSQIGDKTYKTTSKKSKKNGSSVNFEMKAGATAQITAKEVSDGKIAHHVGIRYESSNPEVATVDADGVITAVKKGKCEVYVYAQNGVHKVVKLSVTK